jgi:pimeloyl-ACP methyl ester carboxylesterase
MARTEEREHDMTVQLSVGDLVFDADRSGPEDGTPVVLLHGFPASRATWQTVAPELAAAGLQVLVPDQRGYSPGARPGAVADYEVDHLVADVIGMLDALGWSRVHLVGHDWGAAVAWFVAARHPERLHSLTAVSVPHPAAFGWALQHDAEQQAGSAYIRLLRAEGKAEQVLLEDVGRRLRAMFSPEVPAAIVEQHLHTLVEAGGLTGALSWYRAMGPWFADIPAVQVPTTFIWGARDEALRRAGAERCGQYVDAPYRFVELPDADHWVPECAGDRVAAEILQQVRAVGGA